MSGAGDVNGDGFDDLIIGAHAINSGYVVFGMSTGFAPTLDLHALNGTTGFQLKGSSGFAGQTVSSVGDVNGDGFDDLIIAAPPSSYVVFGKSGGFSSFIALSSLDGVTGFQLNGSGRSVSGGGDVNGDGFDDIVIGVASSSGEEAGESYVVFGGNFTGGMETQVGDATGNTLTANQGAGVVDVLVGGLGDDTLISDGGADILRGAGGDDTLVIPDVSFNNSRRLIGGNGTDTLRLDAAGITLDLTTISDNRIVDFEIIDITGSGRNSLTLNFLEVVNLSSTSNTLRVFQDAGDTVNFGTGWTQETNEIIDMVVYEVFTQESAVLKLQRINTFSISETDVGTSVSESGSTDSFDIVLIGPPESDVVLTVVSGNQAEAVVSPSTLTFTTESWNEPQTVSVSAVDDSAVDGNQTVSVTVSVDVANSDDAFENVDGQTVIVTTIDNEVITVSLDGDGSLTIDDSSTDGLADNLTLLVLSSELLIFDSNNVLVTLVGTQVSDNEVRVPLTLITSQRVIVNQNQGNDRLNAASLGVNLVLEAAGGPGDDTITGSSQSDTISGGTGNDSIVAGNGDDIVDGGDGNDDLDGGSGNDTLNVTADAHLTISTANTTGAGNDSHSGFEQATLTAGPGNNRLNASDAGIPVTLLGLGGPGIDRLDGGDGTDFVEITGTSIVLTD